MSRPARFDQFRWIGDKRDQRVHDADHTREACALDELMASEQFTCFGPDLLSEARNRGYRPCRHCGAGARE